MGKASKLYTTYLLKNKKLVKSKRQNARISVVSDIKTNFHFCVIDIEDGKTANATDNTVEGAFYKMIEQLNLKYAV